jgi:hypothetical protein
MLELSVMKKHLSRKIIMKTNEEIKYLKKALHPKLFINTKEIESEEQLSSFLKEISQYSITPTTLKTRIFEKSLEEPLFREHYRYNDNSVVRYGINASATKVNLKESTILDESTTLIDTTIKVEKSVKSSQYKAEDAKKVTLHSLEKCLATQAINYLLESNNKTVLIDIFARDNGKVKILKDEIPEMHAVVLYKNPLDIDGKHEILVIDPSNFTYSSHLSNLNTQLEHKLLSKIVTLHKTLQIYKPIKDCTGGNLDQYRDCIDIAVKLAFGFNMQKEQMIDFNDLKDHDVIKMISNIPDIDRSIIVKNLAVRIKQASDIDIVKKFDRCTEVINKSQEISFYVNPTLSKHKKITEEYSNIVTQDNYQLILDDLLNLNKLCVESITNDLNIAHEELLGFVKHSIEDL